MTMEGRERDELAESTVPGVTEGQRAFRLVIAKGPADQAVYVGQTATFSVIARGGVGPLHYSWYRNRRLVARGPRSSYTTPPTSRSDDRARFYVTVSDGSGHSATTSPATLHVKVWSGFVATGSMMTARLGHAATLLPNGQVLITGGADSKVALSSAELYDPSTGAFQPTGSMAAARGSHTATLLLDGKVLIAGGGNESGALLRTEVYDPSTGAFTLGAVMTRSRAGTATLLPSGKVLFVGRNYWDQDADLYDPATGAFTATGCGTVVARHGHTATLLSSGMVLIAGGTKVAGFTAELYDPSADTFTLVGDMKGYRAGHAAALLPSGMVLIVGGCRAPTGAQPPGAELYDPAINGFILPAQDTSTLRMDHTATRLPNGQVLIAGGGSAGSLLSSAELYDPAGVFADAKHMTAPRVDHTATLLENGEILIAGGRNASGHLSSAEVFR